jgi:hypothetical protein
MGDTLNPESPLVKPVFQRLLQEYREWLVLRRQNVRLPFDRILLAVVVTADQDHVRSLGIGIS